MTSVSISQQIAALTAQVADLTEQVRQLAEKERVAYMWYAAGRMQGEEAVRSALYGHAAQTSRNGEPSRAPARTRPPWLQPVGDDTA
jgi:hypothetical protein